MGGVTKFAETIVKYPYLGSLVLQLKVYCGGHYHKEEENLLVAKLFSHLHNLERIECSGSHITVLLDSLLVNHLPRLNFIVPPIDGRDFHDYASCVIYLKDRMQTLGILESTEGEEPRYDSDDLPDEDELTDEYGEDIRYRNRNSIHFSRLFTKLDQFVNIKSLHIEKECKNVVNLIEETANRCPPSVQQLQFELDLDDYITQSDRIIKNKGPLVPLLNVNHLTLEGTVTYDAQVIQYIILKFPQLKKFDMRRLSKLNESTFNEFIEYLTKIKHVEIEHIPFEQMYVDRLASLWTSLSQSHLMSFDIDYGHYRSRKDHVCIVQKDGLSSNYIRFTGVFNAMKHVNIISKHGHLIDHLTFHNIKSEVKHGPKEMVVTPYQVLIHQPLKYCPKLKQLSIHGSNITEASLSAHRMIRKETFDLLRLSHCTLGSDTVLEKLSASFASIKHVEILGLACKNSAPSNQFTPSLNFNMVETDIGTLSLSISVPSPPGVYYYQNNNDANHIILLKTSIQQRDSYYMYDFSYMNERVFKQIDEETYNDECNGYSICRPKPMRYTGTNVNIPFYQTSREVYSSGFDGYPPMHYPNTSSNASPYLMNNYLYPANREANIGFHNNTFHPPAYYAPYTTNNYSYPTNREPDSDIIEISPAAFYGSNPSDSPTPYLTNNNPYSGHPVHNFNNPMNYQTPAVIESEGNHKQKDNRKRFIIHIKCKSLEKLLVNGNKTLRLTIG